MTFYTTFSRSQQNFLCIIYNFDCHLGRLASNIWLFCNLSNVLSLQRKEESKKVNFDCTNNIFPNFWNIKKIYESSVFNYKWCHLLAILDIVTTNFGWAWRFVKNILLWERKDLVFLGAGVHIKVRLNFLKRGPCITQHFLICHFCVNYYCNCVIYST